MDNRTDDFYPTRLERPAESFERKDPVIHSQGTDRHNGPLSETELARYERDGFLVFNNFLDQETVKRFRDDLRAYENDDSILRSEGTITEPGKQEIRSIFGIHELSDRFDRLTRESRLLDMVHQLLGSDAYIHQSRINFKPGFHGKGFDWHSDFETWHAEDGMPRMRAVSFSIALTDNTPFNGPLMLIPGSHKTFVPCVGRTPEDNYQSSLKKQELGVPNEQDLQKMADQYGIQAPTGPAGSLIIFECNTLHASNANMSPWPRSNLFFVYNSVENRLEQPFCGNKPRPDFLGNRSHTEALRPVRSPDLRRTG
ncbi:MULTISPECIES: ectoine hydroxylase [Marinobacter]|jgi:ectoine hydroxylase|uniref:Ectoine hydroxylase n=2 Tax=Marinobacter nauticus TaxID=2743 RepID=A0A368V7W4_MARNT|nr:MULTISPECIES: ectoine hydroxylase [Marinobacter]MCG8522446.1 ectoine hydroxylase [Pseudomonadales bacterium]MEC9039946.1 ectoine hydroxylase [Pseudomonadota bacterium]ABM20960.1 ectoine hydroxylase [Marinobacter nauticus VT8]ERS03761.1 multidrug DMT transporter permease [Marinobacter sp. EN3]KAE8547260.1 Ectoine hydroxylase [Marinobacter nauticus]|tara:strand:- start:3589 stop:4524 length:936 start_codon:yes stop_codon:yes gene_type:complete